MHFEGRASTPFFPTRRLAAVLRGLLVVDALLGGIHLLLGPLAGLDPSRTLDLMRGLMAAATGAAFVHWLYLSRANLRAFGMRHMRYPRVWTVGSFLVPALNLVRPYQVVREIWQASNPEIADPVGWKHADVPPLLIVWWSTVVTWAVLATTALAMHGSVGGSAPRLTWVDHIAVLGELAGMIGAVLGLLVVSNLSGAQHEKWEQLNRRRALRS